MKKREEVPVCDTWDLADILQDDAAWEALFRETQEEINGYKRFEGHLAESGGMLLECLKFDEDISLKVERLYVYGKQKSDQDTGNGGYQDFAARALVLSYKAAGLSAFIIPEILAMDGEVLKAYRDELSGLSRYNRSLELIAQKKEHTLSSEMEALLAQSMEATQSPSSIFNMFNNADAKFPSVKDSGGNETAVTHGSYIALLENQDRTVRKAAFESMYSVYGQFANTLAATYAANVKQAAFYASARNYPSSRAYYLAENEIPESVYDNLIETVHEGLLLLHEYVKVRKEALGLDELHMYDLYVPMVSGDDASGNDASGNDASGNDASRDVALGDAAFGIGKKIPYEEAKTMVKEGLRPLGEEYISLLEEGFLNRWIDVYENEGKRSGAYSWGVYGSHPYVLLNYNKTLDSVFTLAHEMGHSLHSYFSNRTQTYVDAGYRIFVAEVASTCNEALLNRHLLAVTKDKKERAYLLNHFMDSFKGTMFRQTMFAEFEYETHRRAEAGEALTSQLLCRLYHQLNEKYYGPEMVIDEEIDYEWARIPHFYTPFYVYQYATGFSAAMAISSRILSGDKAALEGYFRFLSGGNSMSPIELLKLCGVDMATAEPVKEALAVFKELLEEFKGL